MELFAQLRVARKLVHIWKWIVSEAERGRRETDLVKRWPFLLLFVRSEDISKVSEIGSKYFDLKTSVWIKDYDWGPKRNIEKCDSKVFFSVQDKKTFTWTFEVVLEIFKNTVNKERG